MAHHNIARYVGGRRTGECVLCRCRRDVCESVRVCRILVFDLLYDPGLPAWTRVGRLRMASLSWYVSVVDLLAVVRVSPCYSIPNNEFARN